MYILQSAAKSYLDHLRAAGEDEEGAEGADDDALAERLKQDAAEVRKAVLLLQSRCAT